MKVLAHLIYEYSKGLRSLALHTIQSSEKEATAERLRSHGLNYIFQQVNPNKYNVFFGDDNCLEIVKTFVEKRITDLSPEEDFILGVMLGYDRKQQFERYLDRVKKYNNKVHKLDYIQKPSFHLYN